MGKYSRDKGKRVCLGDTFNRLTVIGEKEHVNGKPFYKCKCICGNEKLIREDHLLKGESKSCGCLVTKHGMYKTRLYHEWFHMRERCNKNVKDIKKKYNYADKGIKVCDDWNDFLKFKEWALANGYTDDLTIDRINYHLGYSPDNCRWATIKQQANNMSSNRFIVYRGKRMTVAQWSEKLNLRSSAIYKRLYSGWDVKKALETPIRSKKEKNNGEV